MGICHKYKLIYISIPKTASQSVACLLSNTYDLLHTIHEHLTYRELLCLMDEDHFYSYHSFTVIRNPYERFKSIYFEYLKYNTALPFDVFIHKIYDEYYDINTNDFITTTPLFIKSQASFCTYNNIILVDSILKYESLNESWSEFTSKYIPILSNTILPHTNKSMYKYSLSFKDIKYTPILYQLINKMYNNDFILFEYPMRIV